MVTKECHKSVRRSPFKVIAFCVSDVFFIMSAMILALLFRYGTLHEVLLNYINELPVYIFIATIFSLGIMLVTKSYVTNISKFNVTDALRMGICLAVGYAFFLCFNQFIIASLPISIVINFFCINTLFMGGYRLIIRVGFYIHCRFSMVLSKLPDSKIKNILIVGAGGAGQYLVSMLMYEPKESCRIVGFIDDNEQLWGKRIKGLLVYGGRENIPRIAQRYFVHEIIIAIPHVDNSTIREIFNYCTQANCSIKRFSNLSNFSGESLSKATINNVRLEELLGRSEVKLDMKAVQSFIWNKTVMVLGGAGSIGSEICRQVLKYGAKKLIIFDFNENGLYEIKNDLSVLYEKERYETVLGSIRDVKRMDEVFSFCKPNVVFHAAAHKHVPMMEINPIEAIINNSIGTLNAAMVADKHQVARFVLISTDKAVNPNNYMGASKRIAELALQVVAAKSNTIFSAVRFGNVLGSNGSVIPLFKKQIEAGGPVTVTDKRVKRYFMTIPESVQLVLEAGAMSLGSEIFVLNMGEPIYIYDLACTMIRLSGLIPEKDIPIRITSLREGEKMFEEIRLDSENVSATQNDQIYILKSSGIADLQGIQHMIDDLMLAVQDRNMLRIDHCIRNLVPSFKQIQLEPGYAEVDHKTVIEPQISPNLRMLSRK
ncbi:MAG: nucleoside-diphosphate sugar epimerase/dehydratase [Bacillota bacterium]